MLASGDAIRIRIRPGTRYDGTYRSFFLFFFFKESLKKKMNEGIDLFVAFCCISLGLRKKVR